MLQPSRRGGLAEGLRDLKAPISALPDPAAGSGQIPQPAHDGITGRVASSTPEALSVEAFSRHRSAVLARASAAAKQAETWTAPPTPPDGRGINVSKPSSAGPGAPIL